MPREGPLTSIGPHLAPFCGEHRNYQKRNKKFEPADHDKKNQKNKSFFKSRRYSVRKNRE